MNSPSDPAPSVPARPAPAARGSVRPSPPRIFVVGDVVTDILAMHTDPIREGADTPAQIRMAPGGSAANTAAWLAAYRHRIPVQVTLICAVGTDSAGRERIAELTAGGVDCAVRRYPTATGSVVVLSCGLERTMLNDRGANRLLTPADIDAAFAARQPPAHLHLSGYTLLDPASRPAGLRALAAARECGATTSVDAASSGFLAHSGSRTVHRWVAGVDLLLANHDEARALLPSEPDGPTSESPDSTSTAGTPARPAARDASQRDDDPHSETDQIARRLAEWLGTGAVVVKRGAYGAVWADSEGGVWRVPAETVQAVDPTGAGDAFAAGLLLHWVSQGGRDGKVDPAAALRAGARLGALAVCHPGGRPPTPAPPIELA